MINGIIHRLSTGVQSRELPERFGSWKTVHKRHMPVVGKRGCFYQVASPPAALLMWLNS